MTTPTAPVYSSSDPVTATEPITPSDSANLSTVARGVFVGTGGNISLMAENDTAAVLHKNVASGSFIPVRVKRVFATGTTAADLVAWY